MSGQSWRCNLCGNLHCPGQQPDPAQSGLTAAQKIGLAITLKAMDLADKATSTDVEADDEDIANFVRIVTGVVVPIAAMVEHGPDETPQIREWAQRCPDPAIHDEGSDLERAYEKALKTITEVSGQRDALIAERDEALTRATDAAEYGHRAEINRLTAERDTLAAQVINAPAQVILLEQQRDAVLAAAFDYSTPTQTSTALGDAIRAIYAEHGDEVRGDG